MERLNGTRWGAAIFVLAFMFWSFPSQTDAARRQGDRFGIRIGAWPQNEVSGTLARVRFNSFRDTLYEANVQEDGQVAPFFELYGLFNVSGIWWAELSAGFAQRNDVQVTGEPLEPANAVDLPFGEGRVDFFPFFLGVRAAKELGLSERPHNLYIRGGMSFLVASEQPSFIVADLRSAYSAGTKAAFGFLIGGGGEYYLGRRIGIIGDVVYRMSDLNYTDDGDFDLSGFWVSTGLTIRVR